MRRTYSDHEDLISILMHSFPYAPQPVFLTTYC